MDDNSTNKFGPIHERLREDGADKKQVQKFVDSRKPLALSKLTDCYETTSYLIFIARCGVIANVDLDIILRDVLKDINDTCDISVNLLYAVQLTCDSSLENMLAVYRFLDDGLEETAINQLQNIEKKAQSMVTECKAVFKATSECFSRMEKCNQLMITARKSLLDAEKTKSESRNLKKKEAEDLRRKLLEVCKELEVGKANIEQYEEDKQVTISKRDELKSEAKHELRTLDQKRIDCSKNRTLLINELEKVKTLDLQRHADLKEAELDRQLQRETEILSEERALNENYRQRSVEIKKTYDDRIKEISKEYRSKKSELQTNCSKYCDRIKEEEKIKKNKIAEDYETKRNDLCKEKNCELEKEKMKYTKPISSCSNSQPVNEIVETPSQCTVPIDSSITAGYIAQCKQIRNPPTRTAKSNPEELKKPVEQSTFVKQYMPVHTSFNTNQTQHQEAENLEYSRRKLEAKMQDNEQYIKERYHKAIEDINSEEKVKKRELEIKTDNEIDEKNSKCKEALIELSKWMKTEQGKAKEKRDKSKKAEAQKDEKQQHDISSPAFTKNKSNIATSTSEMLYNPESMKEKLFKIDENLSKLKTEHEQKEKVYENEMFHLSKSIEEISGKITIEQHSIETADRRKIAIENKIRCNEYGNLGSSSDSHIDSVSLYCIEQCIIKFREVVQIFAGAEEFWIKVKEFCISSEQEFAAQVKTLKHFEDSKRQFIWRSQEFKSNASQYFNNWNILKQSCLIAGKPLRDAQKLAYGYLCRHVSQEEAFGLVQTFNEGKSMK